MLTLIPGESWAVLVGISEFRRDPENLPALPAIPNNIADLERLLADPEVVGFQPEHIVRMVNIEHVSTVAESLAETAKRATGTLLIYYAGHGIVGGSGELRLAMSNTKFEFADYNSLAIEAVRQAIRESPAKNKIVILDCCYSGRAVEIMGSGDAAIKVVVDAAGTYAIASAPATKPAAAPEGARYTAFTGELIKVLDKGIDCDALELSLEDIFVQVKKELLRNGFPEPQRANFANAHKLIFAKNRQKNRDVWHRIAILERSVVELERSMDDMRRQQLRSNNGREEQFASPIENTDDNELFLAPQNRGRVRRRRFLAFCLLLFLVAFQWFVSYVTYGNSRPYLPLSLGVFAVVTCVIGIMPAFCAVISGPARSGGRAGRVHRRIFGRYTPPRLTYWWSRMCMLTLTAQFLWIAVTGRLN